MSSIQEFSHWPVQTDMLQVLHEQLEQGRAPHALLFVGDETAAASLTEYLEKTLLCRETPAPCGHCPSCLQAASGVHPDAYRIRPDNGSAIKTGQIEALQEQLALRSHAGGRFVYTLLGVDDMTPVAANRLLKTLEEPARHVVAMLTAKHLSRVLPTIVSRCAVYRVTSEAAGGAWDDSAIRAMVETGNASEQVFAPFSKPVVQWAKTILSGGEDALVAADALMEIAEQSDLPRVLLALAVWFRDVAHVKAGASQYVQWRGFAKELEEQAKLVEIQEMFEAVDVVLDARQRLKANVSALLNVEQMCIRLRGVFQSVQRGGRSL